MKKIVLMFMALMPLFSFAMDDADLSRRLIMGRMEQMMQESYSKIDSALYGSAPMSESLMNAANFPRARKTAQEITVRSYSAPVSNYDGTDKGTITHCNQRHIGILFGDDLPESDLGDRLQAASSAAPVAIVNPIVRNTLTRQPTRYIPSESFERYAERFPDATILPRQQASENLVELSADPSSLDASGWEDDISAASGDGSLHD